ncbi:MAG TPA: hypothetical protein PK771_05915, partial [Spirochaetota bacterium]|nr:hypothetical protein [Spirochaetota bacterium]
MRFFILLLFVTMSLTISCSNEESGEDKLPSFGGITVDENTVYMANYDYADFYAVDTLNNGVIKKYEFNRKKFNFYNVEFDISSDNHPYFILEGYKPHVIRFKPENGICEDIPFTLESGPDGLGFVDSKLWISPFDAYGKFNESYKV